MDAEHIEQQVRLYGAGIGESVQHVRDRLDLSQAAVARVLGVSAPMLSQLVHGQRIKFGNPVAVERLRSLLRLAEDVGAGLPHDQIADRLAAISAEEAGTLTRLAGTEEGAVDPAAAISGVLRAVASGRELADAARLLRTQHPEIAEVLEVYGTGSIEDARRHHRSLAHLLG